MGGLGEGFQAKKKTSREIPISRCTISRCVDPFGHIHAHPGQTGNDPVEMSLFEAHPQCNGMESQFPVLETGAEIGVEASRLHVYKFVASLCASADTGRMTEDQRVTRAWAQQERFKELLNEWCKANGKTVADFARAIGKSAATVYTYRSRPEAFPPFDLVVQFAKVLNCPLSELWTLPSPETNDLPERDAYLLDLLTRKFRDPSLTTQDREMLHDDWIRDYDRLKMMKARHNQ